MIDKEQYWAIDIFKFFFSVCVVAIHVHAFEGMPQVHYWVTRAVFRLGVPFFMVTSSFLLEKKLVEKDDEAERKSVLWKFTKRILGLLLIFEPIAIILSSSLDLINGVSVFRVILKAVQSVIAYPMGALWYLQAILIGEWLYWLMSKVLPKKGILIVAVLLYGVGLLGNSYYFLVYDSQIGKVIDLYLYVFRSFRNGIHMGLLFVTIGKRVWHVRQEKEMTIQNNIYFFIFFYAMYIFELYLLYEKKFTDDGALFITLPLVAFALVKLLSCYETNKCYTLVLRNLSVGIYVLHREILYLIGIIGALGYCSFSISVKYIIVLSIAIFVCLISYKYKLRIAKYLK